MKVHCVSNTPSFGIYKGTKSNGNIIYNYGKYRDYNIEIYSDTKEKSKLYYISDIVMRWVKSKFVYFQNGEKRVQRSER